MTAQFDTVLMVIGYAESHGGVPVSILTLTASNAPSGNFSRVGAGQGEQRRRADDLVHHADEQSDGDGGVQFTLDASNLTLSASALPNQLWILQSSADLLTWQDVVTNFSTGGGLVQFTNAIGNAPQKFYHLKSR